VSYFLLEFAEMPTGDPVDASLIEYDKELNLSVIKGTKTPALHAVQQATETFTKSSGEGTDSDRDTRKILSPMMITSTQTHAHQETSDSDKDKQRLSSLVATRTLTESSEAADSDK
jgi:hypothetical protein